MTITEVFPTNATMTMTTENKTDAANANSTTNNTNVLDFLGLQQQQPNSSNENGSNAINETAMAATLQPTVRGGMTAEVGQRRIQ